METGNGAHRVELLDLEGERKARTQRVLVDGVDITEACTSVKVELDASPDRPKVSLSLIPRQVRATLTADVQVKVEELDPAE